MNKIYSFVILMAIGVQWSCSDSTLIGENIILDSTLSVDFNDRATITARPVMIEGAQMAYPRNECNLPNTVFLTNHSDPIFGLVQSQIYGQFGVALGAVLDTNINIANVDSVKLRLSYEAIFRGDTMQEIEVDIFKLTETVDYEAEYNLDHTFMTEATPVGNLKFFPRPRTPRELITINSDNSLDTSTVAAFESFTLDNRIGEELIRIDTSILRNDTMLSLELTSFNIRPKGDILPFLSFNPFSAQTQMDIHYNIADTTFRVLPLRFFSNRVNYSQVVHDYNTGSVGGNINSYEFGDTLITIDALGGIETEITISDIAIDTNSVINSAFLEITAQDYTEDPLYFPPSQLVLYVENSDGERVLTTSGLTSPCSVSSNLNGIRTFDIEGGESRFLYKLNITTEIQALILDEDISSLTFYLTTLQNISAPTQLKAYGPKSPTFPMTLKISFTEF